MKKYLLGLSLLFVSLTVNCSAGFKVERSGIDKYTQKELITGTGNVVKSQQGKEISFNMTIGKDAEGRSDRFLVLEVSNGSIALWNRDFNIGEMMFLTLDNSERIKLNPSISGSKGKFFYLQSANYAHNVYLDDETYNKIINANSIYFEVQGSPRYTQKHKELTGYLSPKNIQNLRSMSKY